MFSGEVGAGPTGDPTGYPPPQTSQAPVMPPQSNGAPTAPNKPKKPFYQKWWFWVVLVVVVIIIAAASSNGSGGSSTTNTANTTSTSSKTSDSSESATTKSTSSSSEPAKKLTQKTYDKIKSATTNINSSGKLTYSGGSKYSDLVKQIGEPSSTSEVSIEDMTEVTAIWSDLSYSFSSGSKFVVLTVSYDKASGQIISKSMSNF
ncbi:MAG: hypothetical protein FWD65_08090 [Coriobacteriia bacterium]|nr:hypothetical protein [Coriobacteriia bacterium]